MEKEKEIKPQPVIPQRQLEPKTLSSLKKGLAEQIEVLRVVNNESREALEVNSHELLSALGLKRENNASDLEH